MSQASKSLWCISRMTTTLLWNVILDFVKEAIRFNEIAIKATMFDAKHLQSYPYDSHYPHLCPSSGPVQTRHHRHHTSG